MSLLSVPANVIFWHVLTFVLWIDLHLSGPLLPRDPAQRSGLSILASVTAQETLQCYCTAVHTYMDGEIDPADGWCSTNVPRLRI